MARDNIDKFLHVEVASGGLEARLRILPGLDAEALENAYIYALVSAKVETARILRQAIDEAVLTYRQKPTEELVAVVARGEAPVHGQDGRLEFEPGMDPRHIEPPAPTCDESDIECRIDPHSRTTFLTVAQGEIIGRVVSPVEGRDGRDVGGRSLACKAGKPCPLVLDDTVTLKDGVLVAAVSGMLEFEPPRLSIRRKMEVPGHVDFSVGNIEFEGDVVVARGVKDCFIVKAAGDVLIHGLVEAAEIEAGNDAWLMGGMAAREKGHAQAGRDLHAKYLDNVKVAVGRNLHVDREVINCHISVSGKVLSEHCLITGGDLLAAGQVRLLQLGAPTGVATRVSLGRIAEVSAMLAEARQMLDSLEQRADRLRNQLSQISGGKKKSAQQAEQMTELQFELASVEGRLDSLKSRIERGRRLLNSSTCVDLTVGRRLCAGVTLYVENLVAEITTDLAGPLRIRRLGEADCCHEIQDLVLTDLVSGSDSPLSRVAKVQRFEHYQGPALRARSAA